MSQCEKIQAQLALYLDEELREGERHAVEAHLQACLVCREVCQREQRVLETMRAARPLYAASPALRARVAQVLSDLPTPYTASPTLRQRIHEALQQAAPAAAFDWRIPALAAVLLIFTVFAGLLVFALRSNSTDFRKPSDFALMAVDTHLRRLRGQLPLEVASDSAERISAWFAGKVNFNLKLPNYQEASGQAKLYRLEGARLVGFRNDYAALVAYQMQQRPITLVATSDAVAKPSGGEEIESKGLKFHYDTINGLKVLTWSDRGLTYALVSDLAERGQQSCLVCHAGTKDRDFIESLKPLVRR